MEENEEEAGVRMGADGEYVLGGELVEETCESSIPHLVRMERSKSCVFVGSVTDGPGHDNRTSKHSCCLLPSELHFLHLNITQILHIPGLFTCIIIYAFHVEFLFVLYHAGHAE